MALEIRQRTDTGAIAIKHAHDRWQVVDGERNHFVGDDAVAQWSPLEGLVVVDHTDDDEPADSGQDDDDAAWVANQGMLSASAVAVRDVSDSN